MRLLLSPKDGSGIITLENVKVFAVKENVLEVLFENGSKNTYPLMHIFYVGEEVVKMPLRSMFDDPSLSKPLMYTGSRPDHNPEPFWGPDMTKVKSGVVTVSGSYYSQNPKWEWDPLQDVPSYFQQDCYGSSINDNCTFENDYQYKNKICKR